MPPRDVTCQNTEARRFRGNTAASTLVTQTEQSTLRVVPKRSVSVATPAAIATRLTQTKELAIYTISPYTSTHSKAGGTAKQKLVLA